MAVRPLRKGGGAGFLGLTASEVSFSSIADTGVSDGRSLHGADDHRQVPAPAESGGATN